MLDSPHAIAPDRSAPPLPQPSAKGASTARKSPAAPRRAAFGWGGVLPLLAAGALGFAAWSVWHLRDTRRPTLPPEAPPAAPVCGATTTGPVAGVGLVEANTENIALSVPVAGWVVAVNVHAGDHVEAGQPLFRLDDRDLQAELLVRRAILEAARAHVPAAEADLADAELLRTNAVRLGRDRVISTEENRRKSIAADAASARLAEAHASVDLAQAQLRQTEVALARLTVTVPISGRVLQSDVRPGQYAASGPLVQPLMLLGNTEPLHVRVDVDEQDAWRLRTGGGATASPRGDAVRRLRLAFVRFEPYVRPKASLTGDSTERVDTRVLQAIYRVEGPDPSPRDGDTAPPSLFVGQQMDVFVESPSIAATAAGRPSPRPPAAAHP